MRTLKVWPEFMPQFKPLPPEGAKLIRYIVVWQTSRNRGWNVACYDPQGRKITWGHNRLPYKTQAKQYAVEYANLSTDLCELTIFTSDFGKRTAYSYWKGKPITCHPKKRA